MINLGKRKRKTGLLQSLHGYFHSRVYRVYLSSSVRTVPHSSQAPNQRPVTSTSNTLCYGHVMWRTNQPVDGPVLNKVRSLYIAVAFQGKSMLQLIQKIKLHKQRIHSVNPCLCTPSLYLHSSQTNVIEYKVRFFSSLKYQRPRSERRDAALAVCLQRAVRMFFRNGDRKGQRAGRSTRHAEHVKTERRESVTRTSVERLELQSVVIKRRERRTAGISRPVIDVSYDPFQLS
ncbi:uncharacterized protein V6R79_014984 [Siganus canaliculatus]